jgi:cytoskeleton protein RodZ
MESFGEYLKSLREQKGKSLEEIAESTKIAVPNLESIEKDRYDLLPPRVFVKGFIRSYLQELSIKPDEVLEKFEAFTRSGELADYIEEERMVFNKPPNSFINSPWFTGVLSAAGALSLCILLLTAVTRFALPANKPAAQRPLSAVTAVQTTGYDVSAGRGSSAIPVEREIDQNEKVQDARKTLEIRAVANAWVRIETDTGIAEEFVLAAGRERTFTAKESFYLQTGNAGGIKLKLDGKELPKYGKVNQSLSITLQ